MELVDYYQVGMFLIDSSLAMTRFWIAVGIALGLYLICLVFGGIGLNTMLKRQGKKATALAFIPFVSTFAVGRIAGKASFFGQKMKRSGLYAMIMEIVYVLFTVYEIVVDLLLAPYYQSSTGSILPGYFGVPENLGWALKSLTIAPILSYVLYLVMLMFMCTLYMAVYRQYFARNPIMMTFLSVLLPFRGFIMFSVRNNTPVDYNAYVRARMEQIYRPPMGGYNGYGEPYNSPRPENTPKEDPFDEFGGSNSNAPENPFAEFDDDKKN